MKGTLAFLLVLAMILSVSPHTFAAGTPAVTLTADKTELGVGETITLTIAIDQAIENLQDFGFNLQFDPNVFEKTSHTIGGAYAGTQVGNVGVKDGNSFYPVSGLDTSGDPFTLNAGTIATVTFTAKSDITVNTTAAFKLTLVSATDYDTMANNAVTMPEAVSVSVGVEQGGDDVTDPYTASISTDKTSYVVGDTVTATITVGGTVGSFASAQAKLTYASDYLSFVPAAQSADIASVTEKDGTITIIDNGETQDGSKFTLTFTAQADVDATRITLEEAAFDVAANAPIENLQEATLTTTEATIAISPADLTVDLDDLFTGNTSVVYDGTYTFTAVDPNYEYDIVVNEGAYTAVYDEETGKWTISNVQDNLTITATATAKKFDVTITDLDAIDTTNGTPATGEDAATYKVDYVFTLKANTESQPGIAGYKYSVTSITIGGQEVSNSWSNSGLVYTIDGDYITGDIVITTDVEEIPAGDFSVEIEEGVGDELTVDKNSVEPGGTVTLTWTPVTGYDYTIEINGVEVPEDKWTPVQDDEGNPTGEYTYTIDDVNEAIIVTAEKELALSASNVSVAPYLTLNGKTIYLVQVSTKLDGGNVYTYGSQNMYWSEKYNAGNGANAFLVIMDNQDAEGNDQILTVETAIPQINITQGSATTINYGGDVNMAAGNIVDANDAQLVYNMYQTKSYDAFTDSVTMEKFLRADVNGNATVETEDVTAIISIILAQ